MKRFRFRLAAVERHRELQEQERRLSLSKAIQELQKVENRLLELDEREVVARREYAGLGANENQSKMNSSSFWLLGQFIQGQKYRRLELKEMRQEKETQVSQSYNEFLHARQQKKIMEKLHERKLDQHKEELRVLERRQQDELYITRNRLRKPEGEDNEG